jgi:hypothetical protein
MLTSTALSLVKLQLTDDTWAWYRVVKRLDRVYVIRADDSQEDKPWTMLNRENKKRVLRVLLQDQLLKTA